MSTGYPNNFSPSEFNCKCRNQFCDGPPPHPDRTRHLAWTLQRIRDKIGASIRVTSAYRCTAWNEHVGGAAQSYHPRGMAADIDVMGVSPSEVADTVEEMMEKGDIPNGGLGRYKTFTHVDIRRGAARWGSND